MSKRVQAQQAYFKRQHNVAACLPDSRGFAPGTCLKCSWQLTLFWNRAVDSLQNGTLGNYFKRLHFGAIFHFSFLIIVTILINQCASTRMTKLNRRCLHRKCHFNSFPRTPKQFSHKERPVKEGGWDVGWDVLSSSVSLCQLHLFHVEKILTETDRWMWGIRGRENEVKKKLNGKWNRGQDITESNILNKTSLINCSLHVCFSGIRDLHESFGYEKWKTDQMRHWHWPVNILHMVLELFKWIYILNVISF